MGRVNVLHTVKPLKPLFLSCGLILTDASNTKHIISHSRSFTHVLHKRKQGSTFSPYNLALTDTNLIKTYFLTQSRPLTPLPLPQGRQEEYIRSIRGMENSGEEMASKRAREPDSTLSPPAKKLHNTPSSLAADGNTSLPPTSTHAPTTEQETSSAREIVTSGIAFTPENVQSSLEGTTDNSEEGRDYRKDEQISVERSTDNSEEISVEGTTDKSEGGGLIVRENKYKTDLELVDEGGKVKNKSTCVGMDVEFSSTETQGIKTDPSQWNKTQTTLNQAVETNINLDDIHTPALGSEKREELLVKEMEMKAKEGNLDPGTTSNQAVEANIRSTDSHTLALGSEEMEKLLPKEIKMEVEQGNLDPGTTSNQALEANINSYKDNHNTPAFESEEREELLVKETKMEVEQGNLEPQTTSNQALETSINSHNTPALESEETKLLPKEIKTKAEQDLDPQTTSNQEANISHEERESILHSASSTVPDPDVESKLVSTTGATGSTKSPNYKGWKSHQEKWKNKKDEGNKYGSGGNKKPRPNYFVGVQISNPEIHRAILKVQEDLLACDESLWRALVDVATSHITLLVAHLSTQKAIDVAIAALEESATRIKEEMSANPINLTFSGVKTFSHQVVFADVCKDVHQERLLGMAKCIRDVFNEYEVCMPDTRDLHPHLTIAKLSKAPTTKGKRAPMRRINPSYYSQHLDLHFGTQTIASIQLLSMNRAKDESRYYHSDKQFIFDVKIEEGKDHSLCCFPRRPILGHSPHRTYSTTASTSAGERDTSGPWLLSAAGVTTLVAGALVIGFVIARLRR